MRISSFHFRAGFFLLVLLLAGVSPQAKVFRGLGVAPDELNNGNLPWETATRTKMTVNGHPAQVHIYTARYSEPVVKQLRARFEALGAKVTLFKSRDGATGVAKWPDREARFIVLAPHTEPRKFILVYYTQPNAKKKHVRFPVPQYTRGTTLTTISDDDTGTFLATIQTADSATDVHTFYARQLLANGWKMVVPATVHNGTIRGMAAYQKKKKICYVQASDYSGKLNMITLLVKRGTL
jgi:hypothetical protein